MDWLLCFFMNCSCNPDHNKLLSSSNKQALILNNFCQNKYFPPFSKTPFITASADRNFAFANFYEIS